MSKVVNIADFSAAKLNGQADIDLLMRNFQYTCPNTGVMFPAIQCFEIPQCKPDIEDLVFNGLYCKHYQLSKAVIPTNAEMLGLVQAEPRPIRTLENNAGVSIQVYHLAGEEQAEGFFKAACLWLDEFDEVESFSDDSGHYVMVTRCDPTEYVDTIEFVTYRKELSQIVGAESDVMISARFSPSGKLVMDSKKEN